MRLQFSSLVMYEQRRAIAVSNTRDADFDLVDADGNVELSYRQTITWERDTAVYDAACNPPMDEATRRFNRYPAEVKREDVGRDAPIPETWKPPAYVPRSSPVSFAGRPLEVSYKSGERPRGNVALW